MIRVIADLAGADPAHLGLGLVAIGGDVEPGGLREREEPEHVAGRGRGDQRLFGIDARPDRTSARGTTVGEEEPVTTAPPSKRISWRRL